MWERTQGWFNTNPMQDSPEEGLQFEMDAFGATVWLNNAFDIWRNNKSSLPGSYTPKVTIIVGELEQTGSVEH